MSGRILIADDSPNIREILKISLEADGHTVLLAEDGEQALSQVVQEKPDLLIMDVMMPMMTGFEAVTRLKADPQTADIPVVMLSAKSQEYEQNEGLTRGAVKYLCKPFTPSVLGEVVAEVLGDA